MEITNWEGEKEMEREGGRNRNGKREGGRNRDRGREGGIEREREGGRGGRIEMEGGKWLGEGIRRIARRREKKI